MRNWTRFIVKCSVSAALLLLPCKAYVCTDYLPDEWRFWLFQPDVAGVSELLPFTYTYDKFYSDWNGTGEDTANYRFNTREWQAFMGGSVKETDVYTLLYETSPDDYAAGKISAGNTFFNALRHPKNAQLLDYVGFAKTCEYALSGLSEVPAGASVDALKQGRSLFAKSTNAFIKLRIAYQILKLSREDKEKTQQFNFIDKNAPAGAWVRDMALYRFAVSQNHQSPQCQYWLSKAFDGCRWNKEWLMYYFNAAQLPKILPFTRDNHERAVLQTMAGIKYKGKAINDLQKSWQYDPTYPALSLLLTREINKLENWLLTPKLTDKTARFEMSSEAEEKTTTDALLRSDLAYLHQLYDFVNKALTSGKTPDPDFWRLSAAHLMLLDGDFAKTHEHLKQIAAPETLPSRLKIQYQITELLAELLDRKTITPETEEKIPPIFNLLDKAQNQIGDAEKLQSQLAIFLSDAFIKRGSVAKGALLLSRSYQDWPCRFGNRVFYLKLLETAGPADYDELLALLSRSPRTSFERWLTAIPVPYEYARWERDYDEASGKYIPVKPPANAKWDLNVIREFKARHYIWEDRLDSAYLIVKDIPETYWTAKSTTFHNDSDNPFSVGIKIPGVELSGETMNFNHDLARFFKQMIELREEAKTDSSKLQLNYLLLGNAYFNMTWMGRWWEVFDTELSIRDYIDVRQDYIQGHETSSSEIPRSPWLFGLGGVLLAALFPWRRRKKQIFFTALCVVAGFMNCNRNESAPVPIAAWAPTDASDFGAAYYCCDRAKACYVKALEADPNSELAVLAAFMAGLCEASRTVYTYETTYQRQYLDELPEDSITFEKNPYVARLSKGLKYKSAVSCALFRAFLDQEGR